MGSTDQSVNVISLFERAPSDPLALLAVARVKFASGDLNGAKDSLDQICRLEEVGDFSLERLGHFYLEIAKKGLFSGTPSVATECFKQASTLKFMRGLSRAERAQFYGIAGNREMQSNHYASAIKLLKHGYNLAPHLPEISTNLGHCYFYTGKFKTALKVYAQAIRHGGSDLAILTNTDTILDVFIETNTDGQILVDPFMVAALYYINDRRFCDAWVRYSTRDLREVERDLREKVNALLPQLKGDTPRSIEISVDLPPLTPPMNQRYALETRDLPQDLVGRRFIAAIQTILTDEEACKITKYSLRVRVPLRMLNGNQEGVLVDQIRITPPCPPYYSIQLHAKFAPGRKP